MTDSEHATAGPGPGPAPLSHHVLLVPSPRADAVLTVRPADRCPPTAGPATPVALPDAPQHLPVVSGPRTRDLPEVLADARALLSSHDPTLGTVPFLREAGRSDRDGDRWSLLVFDAPTARPGPPAARDQGAPATTARPSARPVRHGWVPLRSADVATLGAPSGLEDAARRWAQELTGRDAPPQRPPWARPGGAAPFLAWVDAQVRAAGAVPSGPPEVVQQWSISYVVRQPTDQGAFFAKAVGAYFAAEPALTALLADGESRASVLPQVVTTDPDHGWLLLADAGILAADERTGDTETGTDPRAARPTSLGERALTALAELQTAWVSRTDALLAAGAAGRPLENLATDLADALAELGEAEQLLPSRALGADERARLAAAPALVAARADEVAAAAFPATLLHGDLHPGNAGVRADGSVVLLDWSDAAVGHPFLDATLWLSREPPAAREALRTAYATGWVPCSAPRGRSVADDAALLERCVALGAAYQVVTAARLMGAVEPDARAEFAGGVLGWSRALLADLGTGHPERPAPPTAGVTTG